SACSSPSRAWSACATGGARCRLRSRCSASPTRRAFATGPPTWAAASSPARSTRPRSSGATPRAFPWPPPSPRSAATSRDSPPRATLTLDVRHLDDAVRDAACNRLRERAAAIARARDLTSGWTVVQETPAVECSPELSGALAEAVAEAGCHVMRLPSGAGHDAAVLSRITPVAMLFVRCAKGISHNPAESVAVDDVAVAIDVVGRFLELLA